MTIRRLSYAVLMFSILSVTTISGCGGSSGPLNETVTADAPTAPAGFQEQQNAIGGNMMNPSSITAPAEK